MADTEYSVQFTIQDLIDLRAHFGHKVGALNPKMRDYIFGTKNGISIIDIRKTYSSALRAIACCYKAGRGGKKILFVGTAPQTASIVKEYAEKCGQFYVTDRWLGGILTNWYTVSKSIKTLISYNQVLEDPESDLSKKEVITLTKQRDKLMSSFGGLMNLRGYPDLVVVFNTKVDYLAVKEAISLGIPVIALVDTDADIDNIDYPIASNDESSAVVKLFCNEFSKAILAGSQEAVKTAGLDMANVLKDKKRKKSEQTNEEHHDAEGNADDGENA